MRKTTECIRKTVGNVVPYCAAFQDIIHVVPKEKSCVVYVRRYKLMPDGNGSLTPQPLKSCGARIPPSLLEIFKLLASSLIIVLARIF